MSLGSVESGDKTESSIISANRAGPLRTIEYLRVLPGRVAELEAQGWHAAAASTHSEGHGVEVVMARYVTPAETPEEGTP